jgi:hypothetical protein
LLRHARVLRREAREGRVGEAGAEPRERDPDDEEQRRMPAPMPPTELANVVESTPTSTFTDG